MSRFDVLAVEREAAGRVAVITDSGESLTYADLAARTRPVVRRLEAHAPGARIALPGTPSLGSLIGFYAAASRRLTAVVVHPRLEARERAELCAEARVVDALEEDEISSLCAPAASGSRSSTPTIASGTPVPTDVLACLSSSGTTGVPKRALLTRGAFAASAEASAKNLGWTPRDRWLLCMPIAHIGGLSIATRCLAARSTVVVQPRFDEHAVLEAIRGREITLLSVVPAMLERLLAADSAGALARPRAILVGGAAARDDLLAECRARGVSVLATYGLTEACSQVTCQAPGSREAFPPRTSGRPLSGVELAILGPEGAPAFAGFEGRIAVRGPTLMLGYDGEPPLASSAWFDTGDHGRLVEGGHLEVLGRRVDLIVTGGENVSPVEVEGRLRRVPGVADAMVFGVEDRHWGQVVAAAIVAQGPSFDLAALARSIRADLASFKRPRLVCVVNALPTTPAGKLDRAGASAKLAAFLRPLGRAPS